MAKERNYLERQLKLIREEYLLNLNEQKASWTEERRDLLTRIVDLQSLVSKLEDEYRERWSNGSSAYDDIRKIQSRNT